MPRRLTPRTTLDNLRKEAKRWLKALRDNVADARARLERAVPDAPPSPGLRDVQHALAREHGLTGWPALKAALAGRALTTSPDVEMVDRFLGNACPDHHVRGGPAHVRARHTAMRLLAQHPDIAHHSFATEIVCGDLDAVTAALAANPELASAKGAPSAARSGVGGGGRWQQADLDRDLGAKGWESLLYLCFTRLPHPPSNDNALAMAGVLLDHGADPNAFFMAGDSRYTPLVGAIGEGEEDRPPHPHRDELVRLLLARGAEPYDIQVIYNIHFHADVLWFLELIHARSLELGRAADWADPDWKMLDMGGYGCGARWHLWVAIKHNDVALARWCLEHGANPEAGPARAKTLPQGSLYEEAVRRGCTEIAELLVAHGATRTAVVMEGIARFAAAAFRLDRDAVLAELAAHSEYRDDARAMIEAASRGRIDVVTLLLDAGVSPDVANKENERPLHRAAYGGYIDIAKLLIERGAEIDPVETNWHNTPLAAAIYSQHQEMIDLLGPLSRDMWELVYSGQLARVRQLLGEQPELARLSGGGHTLLMWLPPQDEGLALELAQLLVAHGADPSLRNKEGQTAADRAEAQGMVTVAEFLRGARPDDDRPTMARFEQMAANLLEAYRTGAPEAMERYYADTWHRRAWPGMRRYSLLDLHRVPAPDDAYIDISLDDARKLIAKDQRFDSWEALAAHVASLPHGKRMHVARPVGAFRPGEDGEPMDRVIARDWRTVIDAAQERRLPVIAGHGQMTDEALAEISRLDHITTLQLNGCKQLTDAGIRHLARMPNLRQLDLGGTAVTDASLAALGEISSLESLSLEWTAVTDAGVAHLSPLPNLQRVNLMWTRSGDGAIAALAGKPTLRIFSSGNAVTDEGIQLLHGFPVFKQWQGVEPGGDAADLDGGPNSLLLRGSFSDRGLAQLVGLDGLFGLNIWDNNLNITAAGLAPLVALPHLGRLAIEAHDDTMPYIAALPHLRFLMCQDTDAGDAGWMALARSQSIEEIWGRQCHGLASRGFAALSKMPRLRNLAASCLNVPDEAIALLPEFPALRELDPMDIPDEGYRHIGRCENLEVLTLMYCRDTGDRATEHITGLRRLRRYFASYTQITDRTPELLSTIDSLEEIALSGCAGPTNAGIAALARLPRLKKLDVDDTLHVTPEVASKFRPDVRVRIR